MATSSPGSPLRFSWIIHGRAGVAACALPVDGDVVAFDNESPTRRLRDVLSALADAGVSAIVTLGGREPALDADAVARAGFRLDTSYAERVLAVTAGSSSSLAEHRRRSRSRTDSILEAASSSGTAAATAGAASSTAAPAPKGASSGATPPASGASTPLGSLGRAATSIGRAALSLTARPRAALAGIFGRQRAFKYLHLVLEGGTDSRGRNGADCACGAPSLVVYSELLAFYAACVVAPASAGASTASSTAAAGGGATSAMSSPSDMDGRSGLAVACFDGGGAAEAACAALLCFRGQAKDASVALRVVRQDRANVAPVAPGTACADAFLRWHSAWTRNFSFVGEAGSAVVVAPSPATSLPARDDVIPSSRRVSSDVVIGGSADGIGASPYSARIAGMAYPGRGRHALAADLAFIEEAGIGAIVSVCEDDFIAKAAEAGYNLVPWRAESTTASAASSTCSPPFREPAPRSFYYLHLPTVIMEAPSPEAISTFLAFLDSMGGGKARALHGDGTAPSADAWTGLQPDAAMVSPRPSARSGVAVHCLAGQGRTGTLLAAALLARRRAALVPGAPAINVELAVAEAVEQLRRTRPGSIESAVQERAVRAVAERLFLH